MPARAWHARKHLGNSFSAVALPPTREGDLLLFAHGGAYGRAMASTYNLRDLPAEIVLD